MKYDVLRGGVWTPVDKELGAKIRAMLTDTEGELYLVTSYISTKGDSCYLIRSSETLQEVAILRERGNV
jgi:hypothetical protein